MMKLTTSTDHLTVDSKDKDDSMTSVNVPDKSHGEARKGRGRAGSYAADGADSDQRYDASAEAVSTVKAWCGDTTAHGFSNVVRDERWSAFRIVWLCIVLLALVGNCYHLSTVIADYLTYPTSEVTSINTLPPPFPYVTICNQMGPSQSETDELLDDPSSHLSQYLTLVQDNAEAFEAYRNDTGIIVEDILLSPTGVFNNLNKREISEIGHSIDDFVLSCNYAGIECDLRKDFKKFVDSAFFNCFTFTGKKVTKNRDIGTGPSHGLSLILYLESTVDGDPYNLTAFRYNRYSNVQNAMGVRVELHDGNELPSPQDAGFDIMPGHSTSMALQATEIVKQPHPYGNCTDRTRLKRLPDYKYSSARCLDECAAEFVFDACGCATVLYPLTHYIRKHNKHDYCAKFDNASGMTTDQLLANIECETKHLLHFSGKQKHRHDCGCFESCDYIIYDEIISEALWPAPVYLYTMYEEYVLSHDDAASLKAYEQLYDLYTNQSRAADFKDLVWHNFVRLNIYFRDVLIINIDEYPIYNPFTLLANIGGTIGLWAGLSFITLIEVGFLIVNLCVVLAKKCKNRNRIAS